jgi:uncharacterized membrane protein HdeD (DUF308 family)
MIVIAGGWWTFVLRGILAILFGVLTFLMPGMALVTLVFVFGIYAIADGVFNIVAAFSRHRPPEEAQQPWWALLIQGVLGIIAGVLAFVIPGLTALALLYLIAAWAIVTGAFAVAAAIRLRKHIRGEWVMALTGVLSILFGILLFAFPGPGALAVVLWIGAYAVVLGVMLIALGIRLRKWIRTIEGHEPGHGRGFPPTMAPSH